MFVTLLDFLKGPEYNWQWQRVPCGDTVHI